LIDDVKNQGELYMIIDLLRNDLNSIEKPVAKVLKKKAMVKVPGLIHQMGVIKAVFSKRITIGKIVRSLFPGGSITGAPKKSTVQILRKLEHSPRGVYTGSTMLVDSERVCCSINIRTAEVDLEKKELSYGAGGGITLMSDWESEFVEMQEKVESFIQSLT